MTGKSGDDLEVQVPCGTVIRDIDTSELIGDLIDPGQQCKVAESKKQRGGTETCIQVPARGIGPVNEPNANDVLCGRVHSNSRHPGNIQFRKLTHARKKEYLDKSTTRLERTRIATDVVHFIRMERGGRFLKEDPDGGWFDIGDAEAIKKVRRALL